MLKNNNGIYIIGDSLKFDNSKYPNDKYDRNLYIPKGYILPSGEMLTKEYGRLHGDMAKRFIEENYYNSFKNDFIKDYKDYMLMRIHALQVLSCGKNRILYCDDHINSIISKAIASYLEYGWSEMIIPNPTNCYFDYLYYCLLGGLGYELYGVEECKKYEKKIIK
ncbi:MAG: hypothetical protein ACI4OG_02270 [Bacilli bacterium]